MSSVLWLKKAGHCISVLEGFLSEVIQMKHLQCKGHFGKSSLVGISYFPEKAGWMSYCSPTVYSVTHYLYHRFLLG